MPKRIVDGEALWTSSKLAKVQPAEFRGEFANLLPLALANGVFEADTPLVWSRVYSFNRPDISPEGLEQILDEFERVDLIRRFTDDRGKIWGYFPGIDKPGRLPSKSSTHRKDYISGVSVPESVLNPMGIPCDSHVNPMYGRGRGRGVGGGMGIGLLSSKEQKKEGERAEERARSTLAFSGKKLQITENQNQVLKSAFPWVALESEYRKMDSWLVANPQCRYKSWSRFAHNWVTKIPKPKGESDLFED